MHKYTLLYLLSSIIHWLLYSSTHTTIPSDIYNHTFLYLLSYLQLLQLSSWQCILEGVQSKSCVYYANLHFGGVCSSMSVATSVALLYTEHDIYGTALHCYNLMYMCPFQASYEQRCLRIAAYTLHPFPVHLMFRVTALCWTKLLIRAQCSSGKGSLSTYQYQVSGWVEAPCHGKISWTKGFFYSLGN